MAIVKSYLSLKVKMQLSDHVKKLGITESKLVAELIADYLRAEGTPYLRKPDISET